MSGALLQRIEKLMHYKAGGVSSGSLTVPPATIKYDIALNYTDALSHVTSQERVQLENSLCTSVNMCKSWRSLC